VGFEDFLHAYTGLLFNGFDDKGVCLSRGLDQKTLWVGVRLPSSSGRIV
jgi:hypothetical protein